MATTDSSAANPGRHIETFRAEWNGIALEISWEPDWLGVSAAHGYELAHLQIVSVSPERAPLPVTDTGYRSHFTAPDEVLAKGGPVAFALAWLDQAARSPKWRERQAAQQQRSLF